MHVMHLIVHDLFTYVLLCVYVHVYMYIHTYTHTHKFLTFNQNVTQSSGEKDKVPVYTGDVH